MNAADGKFGCTGVLLVLLLVLAGFSGCSFAPKYAPPLLPTPAAFKELTPEQFQQTEGWKTAEPNDEAVRGHWWEVFGDSQLNALEAQAGASNQTVEAAFQNFLAARAVTKQARSGLFPTVTAVPSVSRARVSASPSSGGGSSSRKTE